MYIYNTISFYIISIITMDLIIRIISSRPSSTSRRLVAVVVMLLLVLLLHTCIIYTGSSFPIELTGVYSTVYSGAARFQLSSTQLFNRPYSGSFWCEKIYSGLFRKIGIAWNRPTYWVGLFRLDYIDFVKQISLLESE